MNFLFDGRMDVRDLPDEVSRVVRLLIRSEVSHLYQVRLQLKLLNRDNELVVQPDQADLRDIMRIPALKDVVLLETFSDGFDSESIEVSKELSYSANKRTHIATLRSFTGDDRGPPTVPKLLKVLAAVHHTVDLDDQ